MKEVTSNAISQVEVIARSGAQKSGFAAIDRRNVAPLAVVVELGSNASIDLGYRCMNEEMSFADFDSDDW